MNQHHSLAFGHEKPDRPGERGGCLFLGGGTPGINKKGIAAKGKNCWTGQGFNPPVLPFDSI
jgi:hypothetical protein